MQYLTEDSHWLIYLALLISVTALLCALFRRRPAPVERSRHDSKDWREELQYKANERDLRELAVKVRNLEERFKQMEQPLQREHVWDDFERRTAEPEPDHQEEEAQTTFFAKLANLDNGFSASLLSVTQNGEQVYEIHITGDTGTYRISEDPSAQRYALAEPDYTLGKACELLGTPYKGCRIILRSEGTLQRSAGDWIIQQKAQIEFR
ncbi:hypothetical protein BEL04_08425 [Mucilaginibacter sp. PPCGB 2223]|uniref:hypothetical protein n=1 Tax=Mucilaginibacter sp. PPCGB 2223 TaxID=1886027 RepID=UPI00082415C9|nr:hypothetical protein [Mucilaginibacter sp. PPCGB 2223]OCX54273.1 hypothetical protein BEL04_08425 [Mucilaginibacter sp. PPCGB 2223]